MSWENSIDVKFYDIITRAGIGFKSKNKLLVELTLYKINVIMQPWETLVDSLST